MKCKGEFIYKGISTREGGEFTNAQNQLIKFDPAFVLQLDEETSEGIYERKLKFPISNKELFNSLKELMPYTKINLEFDVSIFNNQAKLIPLRLCEAD